MDQEKVPALANMFRFRPEWWWDPVPEWYFGRLEQEAVRELAVVQLGLRRTVLQAQLEAIDKAEQIVRKGG